MATTSKKGEIKLNKKHQGKEFSNKFHFVGLVKPVQKKDDVTDSWFDVEIFDTNITKSKKPRRVTQFIVETANRNDLRVEIAGMEQDKIWAYSSKHRRTQELPFSLRHDKSVLEDETFKVIESDWDKAERIGNIVEVGMWVDVKGHYEFNTFNDDDGKEITITKRIIDMVSPLKNGQVIITGLDEGDTFQAFDSEVDGKYLGMGKADKEGIATIRVGWLNPTGGELFITKIEADGTEGKRTKLEYTDGSVKVGERITVINNTATSSIRVDKESGGGYEYVDYIRDFKDPEFFEINKFEMQLGIRSTYQHEETLHTKVNGVYLGYGKEKSVPYHIELDVYHVKPEEEGKASLATAFSRLANNSFLVVEGIDNNRAETVMVEVEETDSDNPFADVSEKTIEYVEMSAGTKKGLEILRYIQGTYVKELLTDDEIYVSKEADPFEELQKVEILDEELPF